MFDIQKTKEELLQSKLKAKKTSVYEKLCNFSERILSIPFPEKMQKKFQEPIDFCHLYITPAGVLSFTILFTAGFSLLSVLLTAIGIIPFKLMLILFSGILGMGYFIFRYPSYYVTQYKIKATSEMVLTVLYLTVSMKVRSNLENAVIFAATNLKGPMGSDLSELMWDVYNGKYYSVEVALDDFIKKWKLGNEEFTQAINLIKTSLYQSYAERDKVLEEAVEIVLLGSKNQMKDYSRELRSSLTLLNALGILLPIIGLIFFPMIAVFMPDTVKPIALVIGYNISLPIVIFLLMRSFLTKRPTTFHQPEIIEIKKSIFQKIFSLKIIIPVLMIILLSGFGLYKLLSSQEHFSFGLLLYSLLVLVGVSGGIISYSFLDSMPKMKAKNKIVEMESELHMVLFQLGHQIRSGGSIESNILKIKTKIQELKVSDLFGSIISNIQIFGMTFQNAVFNEKNGAIYQYPSNLIKAILKAISEISSSGSAVLSQSLISISNYLRNISEVEEYLKDVLSEVISTMKIQALALAPLSSGIVVALTAMMISMMLSLSGWTESVQGNLGSYGPVGDLGGDIFKNILSIDKIISIHYFQLIVGFYMIEVVVMLSIFMSIIEYGDEKIQRTYDLGKNLLTAIIIYSITMIVLYLILTSMIKMMWVA
ncbi:MAG: hypothetical protein COY38_03170 [Candidatus Aenigmarchaeota archaeon CG_4_10_14_0_8_um_filter_37_24]|nr:hypothetical protein [Candidatus Aenigmarchaeota archaeon]PIW41536.1 MAG: hypothetical protein COW21_01420 [Candidatus Aenigmarchaeota archaeon CG15_BIG_FIL_POST_REV_8_21_14_020_37_27]PIX51081.1 MAG: hypothetical protein COZ52_00770 [Candidatus Aenigmarchaeota archaeon CG_4_8_14_3_um_filter_37_24]PIY35414.1 MAG: hypothetical protein COZ04_03630 [Candidatus Aenigmarchaeota archaeon CG_4_10_14_3_um_filter_37_21]PIZ35000.1 MAG: hypothetical protein COY38_03170 [Candidatus Aenigmarchaeota archae